MIDSLHSIHLMFPSPNNLFAIWTLMPPMIIFAHWTFAKYDAWFVANWTSVHLAPFYYLINLITIKKMQKLPKDVISKIALDNFDSALEIEAFAQSTWQNRRAIDIDKIFRKWEQRKMPNDRWRILSQEMSKKLYDDYIFTKEDELDIHLVLDGTDTTIQFISDLPNKKLKIEQLLFNLKLLEFDKFQYGYKMYTIEFQDRDYVIYKLLENGYSLNVNFFHKEYVISNEVY